MISEIEDKSTDSFEDSQASSETEVNAAFKLFLVIWKEEKEGMRKSNSNAMEANAEIGKLGFRFVHFGASWTRSLWISDSKALRDGRSPSVEFGAPSFRSDWRDNFEIHLFWGI